MNSNLKFRCLAAAYEYIVNRRYTDDAKRDKKVREFLWYVIDDMKVIARRREAARRRRQERKKAAAQRRVALQGQNSDEIQCFIADVDEYRRNPSLFMFDGFMHYLLSPAGKALRPVVPAGKSLGELMMKFRKWAVETCRVADISKLNVFRDVFVRNLTRFA